MPGKYITAVLRFPEPDDPTGFVRIPFAVVNRCDHLTHICQECFDSWANDHALHLRRTVAGRTLLEQVDPARLSRLGSSTSQADAGDPPLSPSPTTQPRGDETFAAEGQSS